MFNKNKYRKTIITSLVLAMVLGSGAWAAGEIYSKKIEAIYGKIKFSHEGEDISEEIEESFTVDNRAYVPLRSVAEVLGMDVDYNYRTHTVNMKKGQIEGSQEKLERQNKEIRALKRKINKLKGLEDPSVKIILRETEDSLRKKYASFGQVNLDINLVEEVDHINIEIKTDLTLEETREKWINIKHGSKDALIEDAIFKLNEGLPEYSLKGYIYDESSEKNLYEFEQKDEKLDIYNMDYVDSGFYYDRFFDFSEDKLRVKEKVENIFKEKQIKDADLYRLDYTSKTATFVIEFSNKYKKAWEKLEKEDKNLMIEEIVELLKVDNEHLEKIYGDIYMGVLRVESYEKVSLDKN